MVAAAACASVLMAAGGCSSPTPVAGSGATVPTEPERTTTTRPYAVPAVIDAAYVDRVLAGIDAVMGDVVRMTMANKAIVPEAYDRLKAVYADSHGLMQDQIDLLQSQTRRGFPGSRPQPGNTATTVTHLVAATPSCIFARAKRDFSAVSTSPSSVLDPLWLSLRPADPARDPAGYNQTRWAVTFEQVFFDRSEPKNQCAS